MRTTASLVLIIIAVISSSTSADLQADRICSLPTPIAGLAVGGNVVLWADGRAGMWGVYGHDIPSGQDFTLSVGATYHSSSPGIDANGNVAAWFSTQDGGSGSIYGRNLSTGQSYTIAQQTVHSGPSVSGDTVVWLDCRNGTNDRSDIYGYSLAQQSVFPINITTNVKRDPVVGGNVVVWPEYRGGGFGIYGTYLSTGGEFTACSGLLTPPSSVSTDGAFVVWAYSTNIYVFNIATAEQFTICPASAVQSSPQVSEGVVIWRDLRNGNSDIYGYDLARNIEFPISTDLSSQVYPAINGNLVVWADNRSGNWEVYGATVPEPATMSLLVLGGLGMLMRQRGLGK